MTVDGFKITASDEELEELEKSLQNQGPGKIVYNEMKYVNKKFMVTFGQQHPLKDHWIEIIAPNESLARREIFSIIGDRWAFMYEESRFTPEYFPGGKVGRTLYAHI